MIHLELPGVPISSNKAYLSITVGKGNKRVVKRTLTKEGKAYKNQTKTALVEHFPSELQFFHPNIAYGMLAVYAMTNLLNRTWPVEAASRYKKLDASNRHKLFEDAFATAAGIDDSQLFGSAPFKIQSDTERTLVWAWDIEEEGLLPYELVEHVRLLQPY